MVVDGNLVYIVLYIIDGVGDFFHVVGDGVSDLDAISLANFVCFLFSCEGLCEFLLFWFVEG